MTGTSDAESQRPTEATTESRGPLAGLRVVEFQASGPGPLCGMMLADLGADVLLVDRVGDPAFGKNMQRRHEFCMRGKRSVMVDLKKEESVEAILEVLDKADVLIDVFRPGVLERLGLGPEACLVRNKRLIYGRMTGWGQSGPLATYAGHDINYIAVSGMLYATGPENSPPIAPLNLVGDMGGGGVILAFGIMAALFERNLSGRGQVIDAAMFEGASSLGTLLFGMLQAGRWRDTRGGNTLDGSAPWYSVYETSDGKYMAVGANEPQFYEQLLLGLGLDTQSVPDRKDRSNWPQLRQQFETIFRSKSRQEWTELFERFDACASPVLTMGEAPTYAHAVARDSYCDVDGYLQPAPVPKFSRTPGNRPSAPPQRGEGSKGLLSGWGFDPAALQHLEHRGLQMS